VRIRELAFERVADHYGADARDDFLRSAVLAVLGAVVIVGAAIWGAAMIAWGDGEVGSGAAVAVLVAFASTPFWWQADRYRRSALETRRLQRHITSVEPYLSGFHGRVGTVVRTSLAQRIFSRTAEDDDPVREPVWPSTEQVILADRDGH
jgi:hypothetical protein